MDETWLMDYYYARRAGWSRHDAQTYADDMYDEDVYGSYGDPWYDYDYDWAW